MKKLRLGARTVTEEGAYVGAEINEHVLCPVTVTPFPA